MTGYRTYIVALATLLAGAAARYALAQGLEMVAQPMLPA